MSYYPEPDSHIRGKMKVVVDLSNYATKRNYASKLKPLHTALLHSIKIPGYKVGIKFDKDLLARAQNNYATKLVNAYIV